MWNFSNIIITPEILTMVAEIDEFKGAWPLLGRIPPERLWTLQKNATIKTIGSSMRIEGSKLSDSEVAELTYLNNQPIVLQDEQEVLGYWYVLDALVYNYKSINLSQESIRQWHSCLFKFSDKNKEHIEGYKLSPNNLEIFEANGHEIKLHPRKSQRGRVTLSQMIELTFWSNEQLENKSLHPLLVIGIFVGVFLSIQPFQAGNERLASVLTTLLLLQAGYSYAPYDSLANIMEQDNEERHTAINKLLCTLKFSQVLIPYGSLELPSWRSLQASQIARGIIKSDAPDFTPWLLFFLRSLQKQKNQLEQVVLKEKKLMIPLSELAKNILILIKKHGTLGISEIEQMTGANRNTLKKHLANLVMLGNIVPIGKAKATLYTLPPPFPSVIE